MNVRRFVTILSPGLAFAALLLAGCAASGERTPAAGQGGGAAVSAKAPGWVESGEVRGYPVGSFIRGRGVSPPGHTEADALNLATVDALTQISQQILSRVQSEMKTLQRQIFKNEKTDFFEDVTIASQLETTELLSGADRVAEWYDQESGTGYTLLVMDRIKLSERLCQQAADKKSEAMGNLQSAEAGEDAGAALKALVRARRSLAVALSNQAKALAVGTTPEQKSRFDDLNLGAAWSDAVSAHDKAAATIELEPIDGNEQTASLSGTLKKSIVVKVTGPGNAPLAGFPMTVRIEDGSRDKAAVIPHSDGTDAEGLFSFDLRELQSTGARSNTVKVYLDYWSIEPRTEALPPHCTITYLMPSKESTRIAVIIHETIDGAVNANPHTASCIKDALTDLGFQVIIPDVDKPAREVVGLPPRALADLFGAQCDYVIVGSAEAAFSSKIEEYNMCFYRTRLTIDALELESGRTIHFDVPMGQSTKGGGTTRDAAARESLAMAARLMVGAEGGDESKAQGLLGEKFVARFETGAEWAE